MDEGDALRDEMTVYWLGENTRNRAIARKGWGDGHYLHSTSDCIKKETKRQRSDETHCLSSSHGEFGGIHTAFQGDIVIFTNTGP